MTLPYQVVQVSLKDQILNPNR